MNNNEVLSSLELMGHQERWPPSVKLRFHAYGRQFDRFFITSCAKVSNRKAVGIPDYPESYVMTFTKICAFSIR